VRHEQTHSLSRPSARQQGLRACLLCAKAKTTCSGTVPCHRCLKRDIPCQFPSPEEAQQSTGSPEYEQPNAANELPHAATPHQDNVHLGRTSTQRSNGITTTSANSLIDDLGEGPTNNLDDSPMTNVDQSSINDPHSAATNNLEAEFVEDIHSTGFHNGIAYQEIQRHFAMVNVSRPVAHSIPSQDVFQQWISLYIHNIQPTIPMLHIPSLRLVEKQDWLLALAISSLGCQFSDQSFMSVSIQEILRRCLVQAHFSDMDQHPVLTMAQATLLSAIGLLFSGQDTRHQQGLLMKALLTPHAKQLFSEMEDTDNKCDATLEARWAIWALSEALRRTAYCIWMVDSMVAYLFCERAIFTKEDIRGPLPCLEILWEAETASHWNQIHQISSTMPSLANASHRLHLEKRMESTLGEFTRILIIHSLYHWCWHLERHYSDPLTHYTPVSSRTLITDHRAFGHKIWLAEVGDFSRWRDSLCDSVDTIHWRAISVTGARLGSEHPLILHCHFSRMVILAPIEEILSLAKRLREGETPPHNDRDVDTIRNWVSEDPRKARLCLIHAGVLFWHIRRHSANGFYESSVVLLSTLTLWAFSHFHSTTTGIRLQEEDVGIFIDSPADSTNLEAFDTRVSCINLDRPADDELVQLFIARGDQMKALMAGVGDILAVGSSTRLLREGVKLARRQKFWPDADRVVALLNDLAEIGSNTT